MQNEGFSPSGATTVKKKKKTVRSVAPRDGGKGPSLPPGVSNGRGSLAPFTDFTRGHVLVSLSRSVASPGPGQVAASWAQSLAPSLPTALPAAALPLPD